MKNLKHRFYTSWRMDVIGLCHHDFSLCIYYIQTSLIFKNWFIKTPFSNLPSLFYYKQTQARCIYYDTG